MFRNTLIQNWKYHVIIPIAKATELHYKQLDKWRALSPACWASAVRQAQTLTDANQQTSLSHHANDAFMYGKPDLTMPNIFTTEGTAKALSVCYMLKHTLIRKENHVYLKVKNSYDEIVMPFYIWLKVILKILNSAFV